VLEKTDADDNTLSSQYIQTLRILFASGRRIELEKTHHTIISKAIKSQKDSLLKKL
jgi:hypothetical protein